MNELVVLLLNKSVASDQFSSNPPFGFIGSLPSARVIGIAEVARNCRRCWVLCLFGVPALSGFRTKLKSPSPWFMSGMGLGFDGGAVLKIDIKFDSVVIIKDVIVLASCNSLMARGRWIST
jgi:hypothetical protein